VGNDYIINKTGGEILQMTRREICLKVAELNKMIKQETNPLIKERLIIRRDKLKNKLLLTEFDYGIEDLIESMEVERDYLDRESAIEKIERDYNGSNNYNINKGEDIDE
jgi:hypothetical protein